MYSEIGVKIYELRMINKISAKTLADKVGVTTQQMYKYEKGINRIPISRLVIVAQAFNKPLEYFIINSDNQLKAQASSHELEEKTPIMDKRKSILFSITGPVARMAVKKQ
jgi:transcriptional regulator with XRE-family HTH domain